MTPKQKNVIAYRFHSMIDALSTILPRLEARTMALVILAASNSGSIFGPRAHAIVEDAFTTESRPDTADFQEAVKHLYAEAVRYLMEGHSVQFDDEELADAAMEAVRKHAKWDSSRTWSIKPKVPYVEYGDKPYRVLTINKDNV